MENKYNFADEFEALCERYGYTGSVVVRKEPVSGEHFSWTAQKDDDSLQEDLELNLLMIESGIEGVYSSFSNKEYEIATKTIVNLVTKCCAKRKDYVQWILGIHNYAQTEEGKKYLKELLTKEK